MLNDSQFNVLFLCTGNSARSIMAEALLNRLGKGKINAHSAGSKPKDKPHPMTIEILETNNFYPESFHSKNWNEFSESDAPEMDVVITVCSNAANESCPIFPGNPISLHWDINDPAREFDSVEEQTREFQAVFNELEQRIHKFTETLAIKMNEPVSHEHLKKLSD